MTKKIFAIIIAAMICVSFVFSASAYTQQYVIDYADKLSSSEIEELDSFAEKLESAYGVTVLFCITEGTGDVTTDEFSSGTYGDYTDNENGIIIVHDDWNKTYFTFISGNADEYFSDAAVDSMIDAYDTNDSYYGGIYACYELAEEYLENGYSGGYVNDSEPLNNNTDTIGASEEKDGVFKKLADFFKTKAEPVEDANTKKLLELIEQDLSIGYPYATAMASEKPDRGALRCQVWSEKVTRMLQSLLTRYEAEGEKMLEGTGLYVCSICGFVYVGDSAPELCPVCKVPSWKFDKMERRA